MSPADQEYWDRRWAETGPPPFLDPMPDPPAFADLVRLFPTSGLAIDVACGRGRSSVWLARLGLEVVGLDVSPVAIDLARTYAQKMGGSDSCQFEVVDLDDGLPNGPPANLVFSHLFWAPHLTRPLVDRLAPGGILAICHVSEADVGPGEWRIRQGELRNAFSRIHDL